MQVNKRKVIVSEYILSSKYIVSTSLCMPSTWHALKMYLLPTTCLLTTMMRVSLVLTDDALTS